MSGNYSDGIECDYDTGAFQEAADALEEFGDSIAELQAEEERQKHYFWKAFPHVWNDYREATIQRERSMRSDTDRGGS